MNIIITGASKGIGFEVCKLFLQNNEHNVIAISRSSESFDNNKLTTNNSKFKHIKADISTIDFKSELLPVVKETFTKVDIIINNAGLLVNKPLIDLTDSDFDTMFDVNVKSVFRLTRDLLPIISNGAHIVNISSMGGFQGSSKFPGLSLYSASKGALAVLSECMAEELKEYNISSNTLALGAVQTPMLSQAFPGYKAPLAAHEMAEFIFEFALSGNKFFNGKILPVSLSTP